MNKLFLLFVSHVVIFLLIYFSMIFKPKRFRSTSMENAKMSAHVNIVDFSETVEENLNCHRTKVLLNYISTHVCIHQKDIDIYVSRSFDGNRSIWEEDHVSFILRLLLQHPELDFIDIGANIGTYTMYVASLGRFVLSVECFRPNIQRIRRAVQLAQVENRVLLIENALYNRSGEFLRLNRDARNVGGQYLNLEKAITSSNNSRIFDPYLVKTIEFNDLLPFLVARGVRAALMKIDIEGSEVFAIDKGEKIFDQLDIPLILMEWLWIRRYSSRVDFLLKFFNQRNYQAKTIGCQPLSLDQHVHWPSNMIWLKKDRLNFC